MPQAMVAEKPGSVTSPRRRRSGSDTRQRTEQVNFKLLPSERTQLEEAAETFGFTGPGSVQRYLRSLAGLDTTPALSA